MIWEGNGGSSLNLFGTASGPGCPGDGVSMLICDELLSRCLGRAEGDRDPGETSCIEGEDPVAFLPRLRPAVEVIQAPLVPSGHVKFLAAGTRGQCRLGYGQGDPGRRAGRRASPLIYQLWSTRWLIASNS